MRSNSVISNKHRPKGKSWNEKKCSCSACCNKRRSAFLKGDDKLTIQERAAKKKLLEENDMISAQMGYL